MKNLKILMVLVAFLLVFAFSVSSVLADDVPEETDKKVDDKNKTEEIVDKVKDETKKGVEDVKKGVKAGTKEVEDGTDTGLIIVVMGAFIAGMLITLIIMAVSGKKKKDKKGGKKDDKPKK